eukprot:751826-Hanusia_phi.AAC.2
MGERDLCCHSQRPLLVLDPQLRVEQGSQALAPPHALLRPPQPLPALRHRHRQLSILVLRPHGRRLASYRLVQGRSDTRAHLVSGDGEQGGAGPKNIASCGVSVVRRRVEEQISRRLDIKMLLLVISLYHMYPLLLHPQLPPPLLQVQFCVPRVDLDQPQVRPRRLPHRLHPGVPDVRFDLVQLVEGAEDERDVRRKRTVRKPAGLLRPLDWHILLQARVRLPMVVDEEAVREEEEFLHVVLLVLRWGTDSVCHVCCMLSPSHSPRVPLVHQLHRRWPPRHNHRHRVVSSRVPRQVDQHVHLILRDPRGHSCCSLLRQDDVEVEEALGRRLYLHPPLAPVVGVETVAGHSGPAPVMQPVNILHPLRHRMVLEVCRQVANAQPLVWRGKEDGGGDRDGIDPPFLAEDLPRVCDSNSLHELR